MLYVLKFFLKKVLHGLFKIIGTFGTFLLTFQNNKVYTDSNVYKDLDRTFL